MQGTLPAAPDVLPEVEHTRAISSLLCDDTVAVGKAEARSSVERELVGRLLRYADASSGLSASSSTLTVGQLFSVLVSTRENRGARHVAQELLRRACKSLPELLPRVQAAALACIEGQYPRYSKHLAALLLQGTSDPAAVVKLTGLLAHSDLGDIAAVALRGSCAPNFVSYLRRAVRDADAPTRYRAVTCLWGSDEDTLKAVLGTKWSWSAFLRGTAIGKAIDRLIAKPIIATNLERVGLYQRYLDLYEDDRVFAAMVQGLRLALVAKLGRSDAVQIACRLPTDEGILLESGGDAFVGMTEPGFEPIMFARIGGDDRKPVAQVVVGSPRNFWQAQFTAGYGAIALSQLVTRNLPGA